MTTTDRVRAATGPGRPAADGSSVPATIRIVGWITLATGLGLLAVVLTIRSSLITSSERESNESVEQEIEEFRTFARTGTDPETGEGFASASRLLELYLQRQFPGRGEVLLGWDRTAEDAGSAAILQRVEDDLGLTSDLDAVAALIEQEEASGVAELDGREYRWGRADVLDDRGRAVGSFLIAEFQEPARTEVTEIVRLVVWVCLGGLLLTALIGFAIAGVILAPVRKVRHAAAQISRTDIGRRLDVRGRDDIAALASTFNAMLDRLETSFRAQHRFVRTAEAHVRGPLATLSDAAAPTAVRRAAGEEVTTTLRDMATLTASQLPGFVEPVDLAAADLGATLAERARAATPGHSWREVLGATGRVTADSDRLAEAVAALAHNAAAEHRGDAPLRIGTRSDADSFEVWVEDDGPGLTRAEAVAVLDRYGDLAGADGLKGATEPTTDAGLGLAVVHAVADAHLGSAWVETTPGSGARFGLRIPREPDRPIPPDRPDDD